MKSKIVQIQTVQERLYHYATLYALCEDGTVWETWYNMEIKEYAPWGRVNPKMEDEKVKEGMEDE